MSENGSADRGDLGEEIEDSATLKLWRSACAFWDTSVELSPPCDLGGSAVAFINLSNRQTYINLSQLEAKGLTDQLECLMAHEVGHHIRYPHTLLELRRLQLFTRRHTPALISARRGRPALLGEASPARYDYLVNVLLDIVINDAMVREDPDAQFLGDFVALYQKLVRSSDTAGDVMAFTMAVYEALWYLPDGTLISDEQALALDGVRAGWRDDARDLALRIEGSDGDQRSQLAEFLVTISHYIADKPKDSRPALDSIGGMLDAESARRLVDPDGRAIAAERVVSDALGASPAKPGTSTFPGIEVKDFVSDASDVAMHWYRRQAHRAPIEVPRSRVSDPDVVPGAPTAWTVGEELGRIDWFATLSRSGVAIPGVTTLQRTWLPSEPRPGDAQSPWLEIYLDCSGSMPDPTVAMNPQVLAAFALVRAATEAGGRVRVVLFSGHTNVLAMDDFVAAPTAAEQMLVRYIGGGTMFPIEELEASITKTRGVARVARVLFSDSDYLFNVRQPMGTHTTESFRAVLDEAQAHQDRFIAVLVLGGRQVDTESVGGVEYIQLKDRSELLAAAQALSNVLFAPEQSPRAAPPVGA